MAYILFAITYWIVCGLHIIHQLILMLYNYIRVFKKFDNSVSSQKNVENLWPISLST